MLVDLIYSVPTWEMAIAVVAIIVAASLTGLLVCTRLLPTHIRHKHNELAGFNSALVGVVFAVLLAMPEPLRSELIGDIRDYVNIVLDKEWPAMATAFGDEGWAPLRKFHQDLVSLKASDPVQVAIFQETLGRLNSLYDARRSRILAAHDHIEPAVWWVVLLGAVITISFTLLFGMENFTIHVWMTTAVATSLALVIVLILAFDYPFRGEVQIGPQGFENVRHNMEVNGIKFASEML